MADKKISDFTAATSVGSSDLVEIETSGGNSRKVTYANFMASSPNYFAQRLYGTTTGAVTLNVNSTSYVSNSSLICTIDLTYFPATHYRITVNGQANAVGQTVTLQLATTFGSPTSPVHTGGNDVTVNNSFGSYSSGWLTRDNAPGAEGYIIVIKGSNSTVDGNFNFVDIEWRY